jgi:hypothetical protein
VTANGPARARTLATSTTATPALSCKVGTPLKVGGDPAPALHGDQQHLDHTGDPEDAGQQPPTAAPRKVW